MEEAICFFLKFESLLLVLLAVVLLPYRGIRLDEILMFVMIDAFSGSGIRFGV